MENKIEKKNSILEYFYSILFQTQIRYLIGKLRVLDRFSRFRGEVRRIFPHLKRQKWPVSSRHFLFGVMDDKMLMFLQRASVTDMTSSWWSSYPRLNLKIKLYKNIQTNVRSIDKPRSNRYNENLGSPQKSPKILFQGPRDQWGISQPSGPPWSGLGEMENLP